MSVIVHPAQPKGEPTRVGFENGEPKLREALQYAGKDKMTEGGHVVAGKTEGMVQSSQRQLDIFASLSFEFPERVKPTLTIFTVDGDRKIEVAGEIPLRIVFG